MMLKKHKIINVISGFIIPYIILYSLYIQINGEVSPGGGFQAGVIFASGIIAWNLSSGKMICSEDSLIICSILGVFLYSAVGAISFIFTNNYLNYYSLASDKIIGQHIGIFLVEIGIGITVASTMILIYSCLRRG